MLSVYGGTRFTERQRQVVRLIAAGCSNIEIAERLGVSPRTAKAHSDVLRNKLGVSRRRQIPAAYRETTGKTPSKASRRSSACATIPARRADRSRGITAPRPRPGAAGAGSSAGLWCVQAPRGRLVHPTREPQP